MNVQTFNALFDELVAARLAEVGFVLRGRALWYTDGAVMAGIIRVETRWSPPPKLVFLLRHSFLPTYHDEDQPVADQPPSWKFEYPIKVPPSLLPMVLEDGWHYQSQNLDARAEIVPLSEQQLANERRSQQHVADYWVARGGEAPPLDVLPDEVDPAAQLGRMGAVVADNLSAVIEKLTPERMLYEIEEFGAGEFADRHWTAAYRAQLGRV